MNTENPTLVQTKEITLPDNIQAELKIQKGNLKYFGIVNNFPVHLLETFAKCHLRICSKSGWK